MKQIVLNDKYGEIIYEEDFWLGRKRLTVNGVPLTKISKKVFKMPDENLATVKGSFVYGASLVVGGETIRLTPRIKWYEAALAIIPFILIMIWGNLTALCKIVPVVGGAIGGFISAGFGLIGLVLMKSVKPLWLKIIIGVAVTGITFGVCCGLGYAILDTFA